MSRIVIALPLVVFLLFSVTGRAGTMYDDNLRLYNNTLYKVLDTYGFVIYSKDVHVTGHKATIRERKYFFSRNERSEILPLTIRNLKLEFRDPEFHDLLDLYFRDSRELTRYDHFNNEYKLKAVFRKAFAQYP